MTTNPTIQTASIEDIKLNIISCRQSRADFEAEIRSRKEPLDRQIEALRAEFNANNSELLDSIAVSIETEQALDLQLRQLAIDHYKQTGEKKLDKHCSVRVTNKLQYDEEKAVEWASTNAPVMIRKTIDRKSFESLPNVLALDFVTNEPSIIAAIAKDLEA